MVIDFKEIEMSEFWKYKEIYIIVALNKQYVADLYKISFKNVKELNIYRYSKKSFLLVDAELKVHN